MYCAKAYFGVAFARRIITTPDLNAAHLFAGKLGRYNFRVQKAKKTKKALS